MQIFTRANEFREACRRSDAIALVPTMGALHAGHLSLVAQAKQHADDVAVTIFVNPTQFGPSEDLAKYPRTPEDDLAGCEAAGVTHVFMPDVAELYPPGEPKLVIDLPELTAPLEGRHRPGHFAGVCLVVTKLLNLAQANVACFGRKDYQQLRVIEAMASAMQIRTRIIACETLRDPDGLAMSSRNRYLSDDERKRALAIPRSLSWCQHQVLSGEKRADRYTAFVRQKLQEMGTLGHVPLSMDYVSCFDPHTLKETSLLDGPAILAVAARVGGTRLIDNVLLDGPATRPILPPPRAATSYF